MAAPPSRRASPPVLPDELVEEILLRLPPDDPACLLRASLVCKAWGSAVSHPSFRRRFREHHRTPPMLGVLHNCDNEHIPRFIPTTASSFSLAAPDYRSWKALDYRHGRALFLSKGQGTEELLLWEPMTGAQSRVPVPPAAFECSSPTAAVVCAADGCDHGDCLGGPFRVVFVFALEYETDDEEFVTKACVYSSETDAWGEPTSLHGEFGNFGDRSSVLVGKSLFYFMSYVGMILEYDLARHSLAVLKTPDDWEYRSDLFLAEDGGLGVSVAMDPPLKLWSWKVNDGTDGQWVLSRAIHLENLLPNGALVDAETVDVLGFADGSNVIFALTFSELFTIELQSNRVRKVCDNYDFCNLIPVVAFYTPHPRLKAPGGKHHDLPLLRNPTNEETLEFAHELFAKGCKAMQEGNFTNASDCFSRALKIRVLHYGIIAPQCASSFYRYGRALLRKAQATTNPSGSVSKSAPNEESVKITATSSKDAGSSSASVSNSEHVPPSHRGDSEEGGMNSKDQEDVKMTCNEANSDLYLAWKMLDIARVIVVESPEKTMVKVNIFSALAEVCMKRGDTDTAIGYYLESLAILEHLVRPDHIGVVLLNFRICLAFELTSKVGDAIPYCAKAISVCQSLKQNLKNGKEALLADIDIIASAAKGHSGKFTLEDEIYLLNRKLAQLQKKLEELEQAMYTPSSGIDKISKRVVSQATHEQNGSNTVGRAASLDSQVAGSNDSVHF